MPVGRPKGALKSKPLTDALIIALNRAVSKGDKTKRVAMVAEQLVEAACAGDIKAIAELFDRVEGKPPQAQIHQGDKNNPIQHVHELAFRSNI